MSIPRVSCHLGCSALILYKIMKRIFQKVESFGTGKFYKDPEDGGPPLIFQGGNSIGKNLA